ncbi:MAG: hypothetical protein HYV07_05550 [Deltaproteobacteria bacterium]|nr:hypothetical protein [Deltaproteobacteria bacterium]
MSIQSVRPTRPSDSSVGSSAAKDPTGAIGRLSDAFANLRERHYAREPMVDPWSALDATDLRPGETNGRAAVRLAKSSAVAFASAILPDQALELMVAARRSEEGVLGPILMSGMVVMDYSFDIAMGARDGIVMAVGAVIRGCQAGLGRTRSTRVSRDGSE